MDRTTQLTLPLAVTAVIFDVAVAVHENRPLAPILVSAVRECSASPSTPSTMAVAVDDEALHAVLARFCAGVRSLPSASPTTCWARRTMRLDYIVHHLGLALGGRPAAGFAKRLMLPVNNDTLLRVVRRRSRPPPDRLAIVGIDDWAWRRNHRSASIICNLERRRIVTLLPDREI